MCQRALIDAMQSGFSLLEVLMAIALIALTTTLAAPNVIKMLDSYEARQARDYSETTIFNARVRAITHGVTVRLDSDTRLPTHIDQSVRLLTGTNIEVSPSGRCSDGIIVLGKNDRRYEFQIRSERCEVIDRN